MTNSFKDKYIALVVEYEALVRDIEEQEMEGKEAKELHNRLSKVEDKMEELMYPIAEHMYFTKDPNFLQQVYIRLSEARLRSVEDLQLSLRRAIRLVAFFRGWMEALLEHISAYETFAALRTYREEQILANLSQMEKEVKESLNSK